MYPAHAASFFISRSITHPVQKLIKSMNKVKMGNLKKVDLDTGKDEIGILKDKYNEMIELERISYREV